MKTMSETLKAAPEVQTEGDRKVPFQWVEVTTLAGKPLGKAQRFHTQPNKNELRNWVRWRRVWNRYDKSDPVVYDPMVRWSSFTASKASKIDAKVTALDYVEAKANLEIAERVRSAARNELNRSYLVLLRAGVPQMEA